MHALTGLCLAARPRQPTVPNAPPPALCTTNVRLAGGLARPALPHVPPAACRLPPALQAGSKSMWSVVRGVPRTAIGMLVVGWGHLEDDLSVLVLRLATVGLAHAAKASLPAAKAESAAAATAPSAAKAEAPAAGRLPSSREGHAADAGCSRGRAAGTPARCMPAPAAGALPAAPPLVVPLPLLKMVPPLARLATGLQPLATTAPRQGVVVAAQLTIDLPVLLAAGGRTGLQQLLLQVDGWMHVAPYCTEVHLQPPRPDGGGSSNRCVTPLVVSRGSWRGRLLPAPFALRACTRCVRMRECVCVGGAACTWDRTANQALPHSLPCCVRAPGSACSPGSMQLGTRHAPQSHPAPRARPTPLQVAGAARHLPTTSAAP